MKRALSFLATGVLLVACQGKVSQSPSGLPHLTADEKMSAPLAAGQNFFSGQIQVRLESDSDLDSFLQSTSALGISANVVDHIQNRPIYLLQVSGAADLDNMITQLKKDERVISASKNYQVTTKNTEDAADLPAKLLLNDPESRHQWALENVGQEAPSSLAGRRGADIEMAGVDTSGSYDVVVGIIDTGLDYFHEDLAITEVEDGRKVVKPGSNIWVNPEEVPANGVDDDNNGFIDDVYGYNFAGGDGDPMDDHGHGTHCAGVIGALRNNRVGIAGMNEKVSIMGLKFLAAEGGGSDFDAQQALYYFIDMKKKYPEKRFITSNSWGASGRESKNGDEDDHLLEAFAEASAAGILHTAAAGNESMSNRFAESYPANYSTKINSLITVAATNNMDQLATFSSFSFSNVQVAAPGVLILSTVPPALFDGVKYEAWSGTSMATPHVTGLAAAVWAANPQMTAEEVRTRILSTVDVLPQLHGTVTTSGRINLARALKNDANVGLAVEQKKDEVSYVMEAPVRRPKGFVYDRVIKVEQPGAKEIQVCFDRISLDPDQDWLEVLGGDYRIKDVISARYTSRHALTKQPLELCSAPVLGDKLYLRLYDDGSGQGPSDFQGFATSMLKVVK